MDERPALAFVGGNDNVDGNNNDDADDEAPPPPPLPPLPPPVGAAGENEDDVDDDEVDDDDEDELWEAPAWAFDFVDDDDDVDDGHGFGEGVNQLRDVHDRSPIEHMVLSRETAAGVRSGDDHFFPRFVELLGEAKEEDDEGGSASRAIRHVTFHGDWMGLPDVPMRRLFGTVLPGHRTLRVIDINVSSLPVKYLNMFTTAIPVATELSTPPIELGFQRDVTALTPVDPEVLQAIVSVLERNANVSDLAIDWTLDSDQCRQVCQALPNNTTLRFLNLRVEEGLEGNALDGVATSSLTNLFISGSVSDAAMSSLARQLRTNETLSGLMLISDVGDTGSRALLELVKTYNYLITIDGASDEYPFERYMERNARIRRGFWQLHDPGLERRSPRHSVVPTAFLPQMMDLIRDVPTALRRFLGMGYLTVVNDLLAAAEASAGNDGGGGVESTTAATEATGPEAEVPHGGASCGGGDDDRRHP